MKIKHILNIGLLCLLLAAVIAVGASANAEDGPADETAFSSELFAQTASGSVGIVTGGVSDYKIIFSVSDPLQADANLARELSQSIRTLYGINIRYYPDSSEKESAHEILLGCTTRALSRELDDEISRLGKSEDLIYIIAEKDGKLAMDASNAIAFTLGSEVFLSLLGEDNFTVEKGLRIEYFKSREQYDKELAELEAEKEALRLEELKKKVADFDDSLFGERTPMPSGLYASPAIYPTEGQHPRLKLTSSMIPKINELLQNPEYSALAYAFWKDANSEEDGILPDVSTLSKTYNWDYDVLGRIEAKALAYLLTGKEIYGYEAIYAIKNHMLTLTLSHDLFNDTFHMYGWSMMIAGEVYDWCYDLLTEEDKSQIVRGVQKFYCEDCPCGKTDKMTIGFPPTGMNAVQGHGNGTAIHRDYLSFAIAIYDEYPDWWELVGGRYFEEYVPADNAFYPAGMISQGASSYLWGKISNQIYAAWMVKTMSGVMPLDPAVEDVIYGIMGLRLPNGNYFQGGDGTATKDGADEGLAVTLYIAQALFPSEIMQINTRYVTNNYLDFGKNSSNQYITSALSVIFRAGGIDGEPEGGLNDGLPLIWYYGSPMGELTARDSWDEDAAAVFMRVNEITGGNHDHRDAGTFQIYYKGCFTSESGKYGTGAGYGTSHHKYWHQATISHNGILVYNPEFASDDGGWYSGGQYDHGAPTNVSSWIQSDKYRFGKVTGVSYRYNSKDGTPEYAYLSGDISAAYSSKTVDTLERRMLAVYTGDEDFPMFFFVYDYIKSTKAEFEKSFLLHTVTEPEINGNVASFVQNEGKIVLTTLTDGAVMTKIGGEGKTYWVNDKAGNLNVAEDAGGTGADKGDSDYISDGALWGRVQIINTGRQVDHLLNVIYVTDADTKTKKTPVKIETDTVIGTKLDNIIAIFAKTESRQRSAFEFKCDGKGLQKYHISGLSAGYWSIKVDGISVAVAYAEESAEFISFTAPAGTVSIEPGADVRPAASDNIEFHTNGVKLPEGTKSYYLHGVDYILPELPSTADMEFAGWYPDEFSSERIYKISADTRGTVSLYARFYTSYTEDYESTTVNAVESVNNVGDFIYQASGKTGASFQTKTDSDGNTYLLWGCGEKDPQFDLKASMASFLAGKNAVTFTLDIALDQDRPAIKSTFRLRPSTNKNCSTVFVTTAKGEVRLGSGSGPLIATLGADFQTITVSVDFEAGMIYSFNTGGDIIAKTALTLPSLFLSTEADTSPLAYMRSLIYIYDWYTGTQSSPDCALRIDNIKVTGGLPSTQKS